MGSQSFETFSKGEMGVKAAFTAAVEQALYDHGHSGYSGTLAEKGEYILMDTSGVAYSEALALASKFIQADDSRITDKWGPAGAIKVGGSEPGWLFFGWASC